MPLDSIKREGLFKLSQILPYAAGRDWRFTLRPDIRTITEGLHEGLQFIAKYQKTKESLSAPWSPKILQKIKHGMDLITQHRGTVTQLSAPYAENGATLDASQLKDIWEKAENSWWPMSWLGRKKVRSKLIDIVEGKPNLDISSDIDHLITLRELEEEISSLSELSGQTSNLWVGFDTKFEEITEAQRFQSALSSVLIGDSWPGEEFELIAAGRCGTEMASDLESIHQLPRIEKEITKLNHLQEKTNGLWTGLTTNTEELRTALRFKTSLLKSMGKLATTVESLSNIGAPLGRLLGEGNALLEPFGQVTTTC